MLTGQNICKTGSADINCVNYFMLKGTNMFDLQDNVKIYFLALVHIMNRDFDYQSFFFFFFLGVHSHRTTFAQAACIVDSYHMDFQLVHLEN